MELLFRKSYETEEEFSIASKYCTVVEHRSRCSAGLVIGRYSVLPYYRELEQDLADRGGWLINSYLQHRWIARFDYYSLVKDDTFETWFDLRDVPEDGQFVVKGRTNSRKHKWNTQMFAKDHRMAIEIAHNLLDDPLIAEQGVIVRRYEPLELLEYGINDQPFVNEHRIFYWGTNRLAHGFYWVQTEKQGIIDDEGLAFADRVASKVANHAKFFVLDVAKTADGRWRLVEINDGQMSGLSNVNPHEFYGALAKFAGVDAR